MVVAKSSNTDIMQANLKRKIKGIMKEQIIERRRISYSSLLDTAMRSASQLFVLKDPVARSSASRVLSDLQKLRGEMPRRRQSDGEK